MTFFLMFHSLPFTTPSLKFLLELTICNQEAFLKVAITELKQNFSTNKCKVVKSNFTTNKQARQTLILWKNND